MSAANAEKVQGYIDALEELDTADLFEDRSTKTSCCALVLAE